MTASLASAITKAASRQTFYTIRYLVDRQRVADAYRAYAYFRWVDDVLDDAASSGSARLDAERSERTRFLDRQKALLDQCLRGEPPWNPSSHEALLVELVRHVDPSDAGLETYLRHMMLVMDFDVRRRGRLVSQAELNEYTRRLAVAVTEAMHYFIGNRGSAPHEEIRYSAASGAHVLHMLRDTYADVRAGYFNIPREVLDAHSITPGDVDTDPYRGWVEGRIELARQLFDDGRTYFARVPSTRLRLAGLAYIGRFEGLMGTIERECFSLRPEYPERRSLVAGLRLSWRVTSWMIGLAPMRSSSPPGGSAWGPRT